MRPGFGALVLRSGRSKNEEKFLDLPPGSVRCAHMAPRLHPDAQQRIEEPTDQRAFLEDDIGPQQHVSLKWYFLAVGVDVRPVERDRDPVGGLFELDRSKGVGFG